MVDGGAIFLEAFREGLRPRAKLSVSQWAEQHFYLTGKASDEQGLIRVGRTPYMREPMDCFSLGSPIRRVTVMAGSQIAKTTVLLIICGYFMHHAPCPIMLVEPAVEDAILVSRTRIDPMIEASSALRGLVAERKERSTANTQRLKEFPGGVLKLTGANSARGLRGMPVKILLLDEIDEYDQDVDGEGDPVDLARARTRTFPESKMLEISSPTLTNLSRIERAYLEGDRRLYLVACPLCGHAQPLTQWRERFKWDKDERGRHKPETVHLVCAGCSQRVHEHHKTKMLASGVWTPTNPEADPTHRSYWIPSMYSPLGWYSWEQMVRDWLAAQDIPAKLKTFVNTGLAETYREKGQAPDWERLYDRRERYPRGTVPKGGLFLTAGVDVQKDRIELEIVAWGRGLESWSIDYVQIPGDPTQNAIWLAVARELARTFEHESGARVPVRCMGVDTGWASQDVYRWVRTQQNDRVFALDGGDETSALIVHSKAVEVQHEGKRLQRGVRLWRVGGPVAKHELYAFLRLPRPTEPDEPFPPGYCHFPEYPAEIFKMLTAEETKPSKNRAGYTRWTWEKIRDRNEALDCRVYARAAAAIVGIDRFTESVWASLESNLGGVQGARAVQRQQPKPDSGDNPLSRWQE